MEKDSALYQLMDTRMNGIMNGIVSGDGEYQAILRKSDIYSGELDRMDLSKEIRLLIDRYVSEQNALGSRFGMLAYLLGFSDCKAMFFWKMPADRSKRTIPRKVKPKSQIMEKELENAGSFFVSSLVVKP